MVSTFEDMFDQGDLNKDGFMDEAEFAKRVLANEPNLDGVRKEKYVDFCMQQADVNKDGKISQQEFVNFMMDMNEEEL